MKKTKIISTFSTLIVLGCAFSAQAQVSHIAAETPSLMKGTRPLGMGNAFLAMPGTDENAPFYNPAAINDYEKKLHFRFVSPSVDISPGSIGMVQDIRDLADDIDAAGSDSEKIGVFQTFVDQHTGQFESAQVRLPLVMAMHKYFSAGLLADSRTTFSFRDRSLTNIDLSSRSDFGGFIGSAYSFFDDRLQAGLNVKVLHRLSIDEVITINDIVNNVDFGDTIPRRRATGVGFDIGLKGKIPTFNVAWLEKLQPTAGFTWQDVGNTRFSGLVPDTEQSVSIGFAVHPTWNKWQFHIAQDFRELNQSTSFLKKWNIGAEVMAPQMGNFFTPSVRIGGHQGYISAGASLDFRYAKLEFATYAEEAGQYTSQKQLRRIVGNVSFGF